VTARNVLSFAGHRVPNDALPVRWYLGFRLSYTGAAQWLVEYGVTG
jgi:hypothetical protein